jgi:hypothetical protein
LQGYFSKDFREQMFWHLSLPPFFPIPFHKYRERMHFCCLVNFAYLLGLGCCTVKQDNVTIMWHHSQSRHFSSFLVFHISISAVVQGFDELPWVLVIPLRIFGWEANLGDLSFW